MSKASKAGVEKMMAGGDGVTVGHEGANLQVAFGFSNNLVNKIKSVEGAVFDKDGGVWNVPASSANKLVEVVDDMRDFVRNNGVQVKQGENGVDVLFDYNKEMTQVIGAVAGAKFDSAARVWNVPADSKALVVAEGQSLSYLDWSINKMRGMAIEAANDRVSIMDMAAASAEKMGVTPAIFFPDKDHSYTGEILNVNGSYAAQLSGKDDAKGTGFIAIHKLSDLGKDVFKGDDLRIDYDKDRHVKVRSVDVFKQQQIERNGLEAVAMGKVDGANVLNASMKDGVKHVGIVIDVTDHFVLQHGGRNEFKIHGRDALGGAAIAKDQKLEISYLGGKGKVVDVDLQKAQGQGR